MKSQKAPRTDSEGKRTPEYYSWHNMISRVDMPNGTSKKKENKVYLDKKVEIYEPWRSFDVFFNDMGEKPSPIHTLDRKDNSKGYSPDNCRWATPTEQIRNRDCTRLITANGKTQTWTEWAKELKTTYEAVRGRVRLGWSEEDIVNIPYKHKSFHSNKKIYSQEIKNSVISALKSGKSQKDLYKSTGLSQVAIAAIVKEARELGQLPQFRHK